MSGRRFDITPLSGDSEASLLFLAFCLSSQKGRAGLSENLEDFCHFSKPCMGAATHLPAVIRRSTGVHGLHSFQAGQPGL